MGCTQQYECLSIITPLMVFFNVESSLGPVMGGEIPSDLPRDPPSDATLLYMAATRGDYDGVETLIVYGADICLERKGHRTTLHAAVEGGRKKATRLLLSAGADVNSRCANLGAPLAVLVAKRWRLSSCMYELGECRYDDCQRCCAKIMLGWGADADADAEYGTALQTVKKFGK